MMAYPTVDEVIDTLQWEGYREGVDNIRYLATLLSAIDQAESSKSRDADAAEAALILPRMSTNVKNIYISKIIRVYFSSGQQIDLCMDFLPGSKDFVLVIKLDQSRSSKYFYIGVDIFIVALQHLT